MDEFDLSGLGIDGADSSWLGGGAPSYDNYTGELPSYNGGLTSADLVNLSIDNVPSGGGLSAYDLLNNAPQDQFDAATQEYMDWRNGLQGNEQQLYDYVNSLGLPTSEAIPFLQQLKLNYGLVEPDAYAASSPVVSPDETMTKGAATQTSALQKLMEAATQNALKQSQARSRLNNSALGQTAQAATMAAMLAQALKGKGPGVKISARQSTINPSVGFGSLNTPGLSRLK